jgi:hypothetical protein
MRYGVPSAPSLRAIPSMCLQLVGAGVPLRPNASASAFCDNAPNAPATPPAETGSAGTNRCPIDSGVSDAPAPVAGAEPPASKAPPATAITIAPRAKACLMMFAVPGTFFFLPFAR